MGKLSVSVGIFVLGLCLAATAFGQSTVGTITGIVADNTKAVLPGVKVTVTNADTGVSQSTLTNDSGVYSFILPPGTNYTVVAEFAGFKKASFTNVTLRMTDTQRVDFALEVGDIKIEVTVNAKKSPNALVPPTIETSFDDFQVMNLPLVGNDPLALITTMPGYRPNPLGHEYDTVAGLPMYMMNTVRDGLSVTDGFSPGGVGSTTILNPDMISEIRLILSPVDAESGRGNGQIQITTKSGTNKFQWNINYNLRQNALNALGPSTTRVKQPFGATFQYTVSVGGPIWKNHTFYFVNWDHQMRWERAGSATIPGAAAGFSGYGGFLGVPVLTDSARNGIFRYWDGWGSAASTTPRPPGSVVAPFGTNDINTNSGAWPIEIFKTADGRELPIAPQWFVDSIGTPYTGQLKCYSVFGNVKFDGTPFDPAVDCGQYVPRRDDGLGNGINSWIPDTGNPVYGVGLLPTPSLHANFADPNAPGGIRVSWDQASRLFDRAPDRTGYVQRLLSLMPHVNSYAATYLAGGQTTGVSDATGQDGLNKAVFQWVRSTAGHDNTNTFRGGTFGFGTGLDQSLVSHKIVNIKIDHNLASHTRISVGTSFQSDQNSRLYYQSRWPEGADGYAGRVPHILTVNAISTLSPNMVNESRFGWNYNRSTQLAPWDNPDSGKADYARSFLQNGWVDPNNGATTPVYFLPGSFAYGSTTNLPNIATAATYMNGYFNFQDNILPYALNGSNAGLQANVGTGSQAGAVGGTIGISSPIASGCTPSGATAVANNGSGLSAVNCETGSALFNFADTLSWNHGPHAIRMGGELRLTRANELSGEVIPQAAGGPSAGTLSDLYMVDRATSLVPEMAAFSTVTHAGRIYQVANRSADLLYFLSGSVANVNQSFWVNNLDNYKSGTWETWSIGDGQKVRRTVQNELALFVKDDWKVGKRLTLNLGIRYENYGNLYVRGFSTGIADQGYGLFGAARSGRENVNPFDYWLTPGDHYYTGYGRVAPDINVAGTFLPNGQPNYIPGNCPLGTVTAGTATLGNGGNGNSGTNAGCITPGGPGIQFVPSSQTFGGGVLGTNCATGAGGSASACSLSTVVACVWGVQQQTALVPLPVSNCDPSLLTTRIFVGPGSDHPELPALYRDRNNFGPAIGFSYRLPLGARTVLVRGGFQFTYGSAGRDRSVGSGSAGQLSQTVGGNSLDQVTRTCDNALACLDGSKYPGVDLSSYALTLADLPNLIPLQTQMYNDPQYYRPAIVSSGIGPGNNTGPGTASRVQALVQDFGVQRTLSATAYAPGYQDPRTENYTFSVSTNLTRVSSISLSYVGTLGRNRPTGININTPNVYHNPELLDALNVTRAGGYAPLFDQMFAGWNLTGLAATAGWGPIGTCVIFAGGPGKNDPVNNISCPVGTIYQSGSDQLRNATNFAGIAGANVAANLANGNYLPIANTFASVSPTSNGNTAAPVAVAPSIGNRNTAFGGTSTGTASSLAGALLRNGCDRIATATSANRFDLIGGSATQGNLNPVRCFSEDYLIINPSLAIGNNGLGGAGTTGQGVVYKDTWGYTNYHQFQTQYTLRLPSGVALQATYLTSKTLALPRDFYKTNTYDANALGGVSFGSITGFSDPKDEETRRRDYGESSDSLKHALRVNGIFPLPVGPGQPFLKTARGLVSKVLGGWQMGVIYNVQSGQPFSIYAGDMMYGLSSNPPGSCDQYSGTLSSGSSGCPSGLVFPDVVSPLWTNPKGKIRSENGVTTFFGNPNPFAVIPDPQCTNGAVSTAPDRTNGAPLSSQCQLRALVMKVPAGTPGAFPLSSTDSTPVLIMLQNPLPGNQGSLGGGTMKQPGRYYLDANLSKTFMFTETRGIQIRVDATNVLNHATPSDMYLTLGPSADSLAATADKFNVSSADRSALASGCGVGNAFCGRQVQFGIRMINY